MADPKPLRSTTPIPVELLDELWITQDDETGHWLLGRPLVVDRKTGVGKPGLMKAVVKVLKAGTTISIILP